MYVCEVLRKQSLRRYMKNIVRIFVPETSWKVNTLQSSHNYIVVWRERMGGITSIQKKLFWGDVYFTWFRSMKMSRSRRSLQCARYFLSLFRKGKQSVLYKEKILILSLQLSKLHMLRLSWNRIQFLVVNSITWVISIQSSLQIHSKTSKTNLQVISEQ